MQFLLDTNIIIHAHDGNGAVLDKLIEHDGAVITSTLCLAELRRALYKRPDLAPARRRRLAPLLARIPSLPFDVAAVAAYERVIEVCGFVRSRDFDRMIAAHALSIGAILVTDNSADFADIPGLALENWAIA